MGVGVIVAMAFASSGCVTSKKYKMVKTDAMRPAPTLNWTSGAAATAATLRSVIVFKGPGSWKREARWDEYQVTIDNHGTTPLVIENATLVDLLGQPQTPGADPWALEDLSRTNWEKYGKTGLQLVAGAGAVVLYSGAVVATAMGGLMGGGAAAGGGVVLLEAIPVVAVVDIVAVAVINHDNKKKVVAEFDRRRMVLPITVEAGQSLSGSLFFPMTPAPRQLVISGRQNDRPVQLTLDLAPLGDLHLKPGTKPSPP
jgi:hypothetical protein